MTLAEILHPSCALFLDFDGTMVDIAPHPDAVHVPEPLLAVLQEVKDYLQGAVAVISGRPIAQIDEYLRPLVLSVAGVHGAERRGGDGTLHLLDTHPLDHVVEAACALASRHPGLLVENKRGSIALHYRQRPELEALCLATMQQAVDESRGLALMRGKMVAEAKPGGASKGHAIEDFLAEPPFAGRTPVFIGDDVTDEAGFSTVQRLGGVGIKVGEGESVARRRLASPATLRQELEAALAARSTRTA
ncbi:trehalose-phosphatase [Ramlibacter sp. USB13]|uniref:Trehalose 6-phosphate phosphatase n=1 Tax=Ramlibacter cellulosilyticus TaxID=2764187 RepID=A0A923MPI9_9BURK|nr:trehalose-phosphatase [Ramlibacter cellulosilyticus]MBC5782873.1 trehalose-phosphatase [Ramlibacter cellulosilyticus]